MTAGRWVAVDTVTGAVVLNGRPGGTATVLKARIGARR